MTMRTSQAIVLLTLIAMHAGGLAASDRAERERIGRERRAAEAAFTTRRQDCEARFLVTPCMEEAQRDRRETLDRLRMQQDLLDEAARRERAAARLEEIRQKVEGEDAKQREAAAREQRQQLPQIAEPPASAPRRAPSAQLPREPGPGGRASESEAAERAQAYQERQQELQERRAALQRRSAERAAKSKQVKPLPTPASAPAR